MELNTLIEERILVLAPRGRDAQVIEQVLSGGGFTSCVCANQRTLTKELQIGAGAALIAEEALLDTDLTQLSDWLAQQESWSDFPFVLLVSRQSDQRAAAARGLLESLSNVILLERPLNAETLRRATASALRARKRQYQARSDLLARIHGEERLRESEEALRQLNETLEHRIEERTAELAQANDRLMREMTERERAQMALVQAQKMEAIGRLTGGIAHDFNNLLNVILGNVDLIDRLSTDERIKRMAAAARKSTQRGAKLTGQLLAFSRSQSLNLQPVDLGQMMEGVRELLLASLGASIEMHCHLEPDLPLVRADLNQIELAILNLAINSRDAMPDGGVLTIRCSMREAPPDLLPEGRYAVISVSDNGIGINPEIITKVFDPFFTTKPLGKGTGLGLSQVYGIARQSGGTARIESTVGVGTTVEIWLPLADPTSRTVLADRKVAETPMKSVGAKILVVEDDPGVRQFIVECLEMSGYHVAQAEHAQAGLDQLDAMQPDLMIIDFLMPGMNGAELVAKATRKYPKLPIIFATGYADMKAIENVIGNNAVLRKPFQMSELLETVRSALA